MFRDNPLLYLFRKMWKYSWGNHKNVVAYLLMSGVSQFVDDLEPLLIGLFLNYLQNNGLSRATFPHLLFLLVLLPLMELTFWMLHGPSRVIENTNAFFVRRNYKNFLLKGTMNLPMEWHVDHHSGDTIDKIEKGTSALFDFSGGTFDILHSMIRLVISFTVLFVFDPLAGAAALGISVATFIGLAVFDRHLVLGYRTMNRMENKTAAKVFDALSNITTVIILRVEKLVRKSIDDYIMNPFGVFGRVNRLNEWKWFYASILGRLAVFAVVGIYLWTHLAQGTILVGTTFILLGYANAIRNTFFQFANKYNDVVRWRTSVANTEELSREFKDGAAPGARSLPEQWAELAINNLSFSYHTEEGAELHLEDVSLTLHRGERIAFIGESGGGKTTLMKVLRDLYHPKQVDLTLDGGPLAGFSEISDSISLLPQDPEIFSTTIRENLTLGVPYSDEHIKVFTDMARFSDVIERLPHKLESSIVEKGVNLSGGERQRLALARGLLASVNKDIILLDEPTSSVDFQNELEIFQNIFEGFPRQTVVAIVHRLHFLALFEKVYLFENGQIVAAGTFESLKKDSPQFRKLWAKYIKSRGE